MPDAENGHESDTPIKTPNENRGWTRFVGYIKSQVDEHHAKKQEESAIDRAARRTANATVWLAVFTVVLAVVSGLTLRILNRQLGEMQGSGKQTDRLLCLYQQQLTQLTKQSGDTHALAGKTEELAGHMKDQADRTKTIADQAIVQADANKKLAQNALDTLANSKQSFSAEQRAWIGVQGISNNKGFTEKEVWQITVVFFNSGRTPARNVQVSGMYMTSPIPLSGPSPQQAARLVFRPAQSIAPQGFYRESIGNVVGAEASSMNEISGQQVLVSQYPKIKNKQLFLYYYGLLKYEDTLRKPHETQFCILLADPDTKEPGMCDSFNDLY